MKVINIEISVGYPIAEKLKNFDKEYVLKYTGRSGHGLFNKTLYKLKPTIMKDLDRKIYYLCLLKDDYNTGLYIDEKDLVTLDLCGEWELLEDTQLLELLFKGG